MASDMNKSQELTLDITNQLEQTVRIENDQEIGERKISPSKPER